MRKRRLIRRKSASVFRVHRKGYRVPQGRRVDDNVQPSMPNLRLLPDVVREDLPTEVSEVLVYPSHVKTNKHHRRPKSKGGRDRVKSRRGKSYDNISVVPIYQHHAFNELFGSAPSV